MTICIVLACLIESNDLPGIHLLEKAYGNQRQSEHRGLHDYFEEISFDPVYLKNMNVKTFSGVTPLARITDK